MTRTAVLSACVVASIAGAAQAATVEFRIVERRGQTSWNTALPTTVTNDNILDFAVQARVVGGPAIESLGNWGFDITTNDSESSGVLSRLATSAAAGTYLPNSTQSGNPGAGGYAGLAAQYSYLAGINPNFNGLINLDGGSFTNNPAINEIGLVTGSPTGGAILLGTDFTDVPGTGDPDGNPDTYSGSGTTAPLDQTYANTYLGASSHFVDLYRFKYTLSNSATRVLSISLSNAQAQTFLDLALANGVWGPDSPLNATGITATGISITITPAPGAAALLGLGGLMVARRRRS